MTVNVFTFVVNVAVEAQLAASGVLPGSSPVAPSPRSVAPHLPAASHG